MLESVATATRDRCEPSDSLEHVGTHTVSILSVIEFAVQRNVLVPI